MKRKLTCDVCERVFSDPSPKLAADMLEAHKQIAHREPEQDGAHLDENGNNPCTTWEEGEPDAAPFIPDEHAETARVLAYRPRADFRAAMPEDEPEPTPTGTDGGGSAEPGGGNAPQGQQTQNTPPLTATRDTLRALKLINDAAVLELRSNPEFCAPSLHRPSVARLTFGEVDIYVDVYRLDKWAATFPAGTSFAVELNERGLTLTHGAGSIRFAPQCFPLSWTPIELTADESGHVTAPALPSPESLKAARKSLAEARKAGKAERVRQNMLKGVNSASADVKRAEEYAAKLETEAREAIARAEELTPEECDEAVTLAKRVRDLRRLRRAVEQAVEDPQVNTPEFFEWLSEEHRAAYAEAFEPYRKASEHFGSYKPKQWGSKAAERESARRWQKANDARASLRRVLLDALDRHAASVLPEEAAERVFWYRYDRKGRFDTPVQDVKRTLRLFPRKAERARARIAETRAEYHAALLDYAPHVREDEHERYERLLSKFEPAELARAA